MAPHGRKHIENYFDFSNNQAKCKICSRVLKSNRIFNLKIHAIKVHKMKESELKYTARAETDSASNISEKRIKKQAVKIEVSKEQLFRSYIGLVTDDNLPFSILNTDNFKDIIDPICRGLSEKIGKKIRLSSSNCKKVLQLVAENIRNDIRSDLYQRLISLKIDSATGLPGNVFGITAQFIKTSEIQSRILGIMEVKAVGNLSTEISNTLTKYDVNLNQIASITLDNCGNMMHTMNTLSNSSIFSNGHGVQDADNGNEIYLRKIDMLEDTSQMCLNDILICPCAAYTAQLCLLYALKESETKSIFLSCRNFVKFIRNPSNGYWEIFDEHGVSMPQLDCPTKWGSTYTMIKSLKDAKYILVKIEPIKKNSVGEDFELSDSFWKFIEAYCIAYEPLQQAIVKFKEEQLHYGNFYAEWLKCKLCTEKLLEKRHDAYVKKIAKNLLASIENGTKKLLDNELLISCLYLDPRFNHTLTPSQKREAISYLKKLYERIKNINIHHQEIKTESPSELQMESYEFSQKADEYLNEYLTRNFVPNANEGVEVSAKLEHLQMPFLRVDANVLQFWMDKQFSDPELYALSKICFAVPATHVTAEGAFSYLKRILADNSNRGDLEDILLVKQNTEYLDQAIENLPLFEDDE